MNLNATLSTGNQPKTLKVPMNSTFPERVRIRIYDKQKPLTELFNNMVQFKGAFVASIPMPVTPETIVVELSTNSRAISFGKLYLDTFSSQFTMNSLDPKVRNFVLFAQRFCYNLPYLNTFESTHKYYRSDDGFYEIQLVEGIRYSNGQVRNTPATTNSLSGLITVAKPAMAKLTFPERMAVILHEFSHYWLNDNPANELEADIHGLTIYLGLGYPAWEGYTAFVNVLKTNPNGTNSQREKMIKSFVTDYMKGQLKLNP